MRALQRVNLRENTSDTSNNVSCWLAPTIVSPLSLILISGFRCFDIVLQCFYHLPLSNKVHLNAALTLHE